MKEKYISVDIESTGPIPGKYSMYQIGACVVGNTKERFYVEIALLNDAYVEKALTVCNTTINELRTKGLVPEEAMHQFAEWVKKVSKNSRPVFVAQNAPFDWMFVQWYFHTFLGNNPFGHSALDIKAFFMGLHKTSWRTAVARKMNEYYPSRTKHTHNALDDCIGQAERFQLMLNAAELPY